MIKPIKIKKAVYLNALQVKQARYHYQGHVFTGVAFEHGLGREVKAFVIEQGCNVGLYQPTFLSPSDYSAPIDYARQIDFSEEFDKLEARQRSLDQDFIDNDTPYSGIAYHFKDSLDGSLKQRTDYLLEEGKKRAGLVWNENGELVHAWHNSYRTLPEGSGCSYIWGFRESEEPDVTPVEPEIPPDGELVSAKIRVHRMPTIERPNRMDNFLSIDFTRNSDHCLADVSIIGDMALEQELTQKNFPDWPFLDFEAVFAAWPASEDFYVGGTAFDDALFARLLEAANTEKVKSLDILPTLITDKSAGLLLAMPSLHTVRLLKGLLTDALEVQKLADQLKKSRPDLTVEVL